MLLYDDTVDIEKPDRICSPTFVVHEFSRLFLHPSIFSIKYSRSEENKNERRQYSRERFRNLPGEGKNKKVKQKI